MSFFLGRVVEQRALAIKARSLEQTAAVATPAIKPESPTYRELTAADIVALPFAEFYEALRSAPGEAREKWRVDLEQMPAGPRRNAAVAGFYKLLVQFDPVTAARDASAVEDKDLRELALGSILGAAPGFALGDIATIFLKLPPDASYNRNYFEEIIGQWIPIDPAAVARFYDEHPEILEQGPDYGLIKAWAAIDPHAATEWINAHHYGPGSLGDYLLGLYENDRGAAIDFAVAHADQIVPTAGLGELLSALYSDSKEEAKKFIERLPNDELRNNAFRGFEFAVNFGTAEETGEPDKTPRAIADWMIQFPPAYWRGHLGDVLNHWPDSSMSELFAWMEGRPPDIRDAVVAEFTVSGASAEKAVAAVIQYASPAQRDQFLTAMFQNSPSSIYQWRESIETSSLLSAADKKHVLEIAAKVETALEDQRMREEKQEARDDNQGSEK